MKLPSSSTAAAGNLCCDHYTSAEETLIEIYPAGVPLRRVEDIAEPYGEQKYPRARSATSIKRLTSISKPGVRARWSAAIRMSMRTASI